MRNYDPGRPSDEGNLPASNRPTPREETILFKLRGSADVDATITRISNMPELFSIKQLFPKDKSEELRLMYSIRVSGADAAKVLAVLEQNAEIEFAELSPRRQTRQE